MKKNPSYGLLLIFLLLIAGIIMGGNLYYRYAKQRYHSEIDRQLSIIADVKVKEIAEWRKERLSDAALFYKNDLFSGIVQNYFKNRQYPTSSRQIRGWLQKISQHRDYENIFLIDIHGVNRFSLPTPATQVPSIISSHVSEIIKSQQIEFKDFYWNEIDGQNYLAILVPISDIQDSSRIVGMLAFQIDPKHYLYPFIRIWPTPSRTSETMIVRREGNDAIYLNESRFETNVALALKIPLRRIEVPGVRAALGWHGGFEGIDYRGASVIAAVRTIPNSPWGMVAKMDISEAFAPLNEQLLVLAIPSGILLISLFSGMGLALRQRNIRFYKEQVKSAEALKKSQAQLNLQSAALNAAENGIVITSVEGVILWINPAFTRHTGYTFEEVIGKNPRILKSGKHEDIFYRNLWETICAGRVWHGEIINRYKDGSEHTEEMNITPVIDSSRTIINFIAIKQDITARKHFENELLNAKAQAEEANKAKSEFLSRMSHEFRTPLNSILGFAQLMEMDEMKPSQKKGIDHILCGGQHLLGLVNEVLDIARIESGRFSLILEPIQLFGVISETLDIVRPMAEARRLTIELTESPVVLQYTLADRQRLKQVLLNLLSNAVKYNHEQGSVTIECRDTATNIRISVTDTGPGIAPENMEKLFIPFGRVDAEQTDIEGSGLGLTITKKLVEAMGGAIGVESTPGQGSIFWIELPEVQRTKEE